MMCNNRKIQSRQAVCDHQEFDDLTWRKTIEGIGTDAEVITNDKGGKQSKSPMALHLIDPEFLEQWATNNMQELEYEDSDGCRQVVGEYCVFHDWYEAIYHIAKFMQTENKIYLQFAADNLEGDNIQQLIRIAEVLQYGASRYQANNWRLIPQEEHINHALIHIIAQIMGDTQDKHLDHALCRLMMACSTYKSDDFEYNKFVDTNKY